MILEDVFPEVFELYVCKYCLPFQKAENQHDKNTRLETTILFLPFQSSSMFLKLYLQVKQFKNKQTKGRIRKLEI